MLRRRQHLRVRDRPRWSAIVLDWRRLSFFASSLAWRDAVWRDRRGVVAGTTRSCQRDNAAHGSLRARFISCHYSLPHHGATLIHVAVWVTHHGRVGAELKSVEHDARGLAHNVLHSLRRRLPVDRGEHRSTRHRGPVHRSRCPARSRGSRRGGASRLRLPASESSARIARLPQPVPEPSSRTPYAGCP